MTLFYYQWEHLINKSTTGKLFPSQTKFSCMSCKSLLSLSKFKDEESRNDDGIVDNLLFPAVSLIM